LPLDAKRPKGHAGAVVLWMGGTADRAAVAFEGRNVLRPKLADGKVNVTADVQGRPGPRHLSVCGCTDGAC